MLDMPSMGISIVPLDKLFDQIFAQRPFIVDFLDQFSIADSHPFVDRAGDLPQFDLRTKDYVRGGYIVPEVVLPPADWPILPADPDDPHVALGQSGFFQKSRSHVCQWTEKCHMKWPRIILECLLDDQRRALRWNRRVLVWKHLGSAGMDRDLTVQIHQVK